MAKHHSWLLFVVSLALSFPASAATKAKSAPQEEDEMGAEAVDSTKRRPARFVSYFSFGGAIMNNLDASSDIGFSVSMGRGWDVDVAMIKLLGTAEFNGSAWMLSAGLGGNYFFTKTDIAPYVTADFGAGVAKLDGGGVLDGQTVGGFSLGGGAGVLFPRTYSVTLDLGFRASVILHENQLGFPQSYSLRLGIYF